MKPIAECLAPGDRNLSQDEELTFLHALESGLAVLFREGKVLGDRPCALALEALERDLPGGPGVEVTVLFLMERLREFLNLNDGRYSRANLRWACRKVRKSIERHRSALRPDAYLLFINEFIGKSP